MGLIVDNFAGGGRPDPDDASEFPEVEREAVPLDQREWTREPVCDCGAAAYLILIRAPGDPERRSREERHEAMGVVAAASEWKELRKATIETWSARIRELLSDGTPRTFNAMAVDLVDQTADIACDNAIAALWSLKASGEIEHTVDAPVLWRAINLGQRAEMERVA